MKQLLQIVYQRNKILAGTGMVFVLGALVCMVLMATTQQQVLGINAWIKPFKFYLSSAIFCFAMAWYCHYLQAPGKVTPYSWMVALVLGFETLYITRQAAIGQLSHFNVATPQAGLLFMLMGIAISILTIWTLFIAIQFFRGSFPELKPAYLFGIRWGLIIFVVFAFEGGYMASILSHTVGAADGGPGMPLTNWSSQHGDLRIAHFMGMHALQVLPLFGYYFAARKRTIMVFAFLYFLVASLFLVNALQGNPLPFVN